MTPVTRLDRTYWGIGHSSDPHEQRYLYPSEHAARDAIQWTDYDVIERLDPDGTKTRLDVRDAKVTHEPRNPAR